MTSRHSTLILLSICHWVYCGIAVGADDPKPRAEDALRNFPSPTWYDKDTASYVAPNVVPPRDNPIRTSGQRAFTSTDETSSWRFWEWDWWPDWSFGNGNGWGGMGGWGDMSFLGYVLYGILGCLIVAIVGLLVWFFLRDYAPDFRWRKKKNLREEIKIDPARIEDLPFEVKPDMGDPLSVARSLLSREDYAAACVYLYGYMLLAMDQRRQIYLQAGKTNRMYLREIRRPKLVEIVTPAMLTFEDSFFGKHPISRERFMHLWDSLDAFHDEIEATPSGNHAPVLVGASA